MFLGNYLITALLLLAAILIVISYIVYRRGCVEWDLDLEILKQQFHWAMGTGKEATEKNKKIRKRFWWS